MSRASAEYPLSASCLKNGVRISHDSFHPCWFARGKSHISHDEIMSNTEPSGTQHLPAPAWRHCHLPEPSRNHRDVCENQDPKSSYMGWSFPRVYSIEKYHLKKSLCFALFRFKISTKNESVNLFCSWDILTSLQWEQVFSLVLTLTPAQAAPGLYPPRCRPSPLGWGREMGKGTQCLVTDLTSL